MVTSEIRDTFHACLSKRSNFLGEENYADFDKHK